MEESFFFLTKPKDPLLFKSVRIGLSSPEKIIERSFGEVKQPETINYRTFKPERDGLFCAKIFGPIKDFECLCGKYKRMKHRGIVCEKCGVEVIQAKARRERMGHITLATPVSHIWFLKSLPSKIGSLLDLNLRELERVLYFDSYIVLSSSESDITVGKVLNEEAFQKALQEHGENKFTVGMGASAINDYLGSLDMESLSESLRKEIILTKSDTKKKKISNRLRVVEAFKDSDNNPQWMIIKELPVLPPDLRPLVPLDGGRFATSDLNDLYRRVINRNNRLKKLQELDAPDIIIKNEKRMLQEAVDALLDNGKRGKVVTGPNKRPLKSLSDMLKGKQGRFRQNLLGKRVDYSGRTVIVSGPELRLHQCGLPKRMAIELFKPFIYHKLEEKGFVTTIRSAKKLVERETPEVWDALDEIIQEYPIMLNRAPTLHRLGIQAFEPTLIEENSIRLHPLVCTAFNADFDGDQMAVHIPLSVESQTEARILVMATNNILSPANGDPIIVATQDIVLGIYYMTQVRPGVAGENKKFVSVQDVMMAWETDNVHLQAQIEVKVNGNIEKTTVGRVILWDIVPSEVPFSYVNKTLRKKDIAKLIDECYRKAGPKKTIIFADRLKNHGYKFSSYAGISIALHNMKIPDKKWNIINEAQAEVDKVAIQYSDGIITDGERYNKVIDIWQKALAEVTKEMMENISKDTFLVTDGDTKKEIKSHSFNPIFIMADSGARGSKDQLKQLAGMRGLMAKPSGAIIETPIKANFREGLSALEYFVSTHGARKGLADTALKTANSGYLTRRLVDVAQDVTVHEVDCGTIDGIEMENLIKAGEIIQPLGDRILGRVALEDVLDPITGEVLVPSGTEITESSVRKIDEAGISKVSIRSVLTCRTSHGVCAKCYGRDLAKGHLVAMGEAIGIIAAESIGEPGTQLTMRTFHIGGIASGKTEQAEIYTKGGGIVKFDRLNVVRNPEGRLVVLNRNGEIVIVGPDIEKERIKVEKGSEILFKDGQAIKADEIIARKDKIKINSSVNNPELFVSNYDGIIKYENIELETDSQGRHIVSNDDAFVLILIPGRERERYPIIYGAELLVEEGRAIKIGEKIAVWDAFTTPVLTDVTGRVKYGDLLENITFQEKVDIITGRSSKVVIQSKSSEYSPRISIKDEHGKSLKLPSAKGDASYQLPVNAIIMVDEKDHSGKDIIVQAGQVIAKIPRETTKIKDITGGLPRVAELFEVRKPKEYALISEIDGTVSFDNNEQKTKGKRKIKVTPEYGDSKEYQIQRGKHINVRDGDYIRAGEPLMDGDVNPHDILRIKGIKALAQFLVNEIQEVYRIQGVKINDKHIETIVRQMVRRVKITEVNDSTFMQGEQVERRRFEDENQRVLEAGGIPAVAESQLLGITRAALTTESFISAASFQETTKVLTDASISGKIDHLRGLKENVIMGRLIPAGSGRAFYEKSVELASMS